MSLIHDYESQQRGVDTYWFVLLFGYKLVLQIIVTVLAFLVCSTKVNIEVLNDHRAVQVCLTNSVTKFNICESKKIPPWDVETNINEIINN